ncbi:FtsX-like permease family protein [Myroides sp. BIT-d1]|uniref:FtsX-like permease family protein n=1 Tax=Myroides albus TaxID=2562892 RepID=A0A6I3LK41_9FLAO|nr:ABC transporter permease [Myroides albus]MTG98663.1 FtsX-like permease family protein [Myroides albus]
MLQNWLKLYIAFINKSRYFFLWNILGLALGISAVVLGTIHYQDEYGYNRWIPEVDKIYEVNIDVGTEANSIYIPAGVGPSLQQNSLVDNYCYFAVEYLEFYAASTLSNRVQKGILNTQRSFFDFVPFDFVYGRADEVFQDDYSIAISNEVAQFFFGDKNPIGDTLSLAHQPYIVRGVYQLNKNVTIRPQVVLANMEWHKEESKSLWQENIGGLLVKMKHEGDTLLVSRYLADTFKQQKRANKFFDEGEDVSVSLSSFREGRFVSKQTALLEGKTKHDTVNLITACSILIFILSILNYIILNQTSVLIRAKEFSIRKIVGASKFQLVFQIVFETLLNLILSLLVTLVFIEISLPVYNQFLHKTLLFSFVESFDIIAIISVVVIVLGGFIPAIYANYITRKHIVNKVQGSLLISMKWRMCLVVLQLIIAFFFMIGALIIHSQVEYVKRQPLGFEYEEVLQVKLYTQQIRRKFYKGEKIIDQIKEIKGVDGVALSTLSFKSKSMSSNHIAYFGQQLVSDFVLEGVDDEYLTLIGSRVLAKEVDIPSEVSTVVVNQKFVQKMGVPIEEVIGEVISFEGVTYVIESVIADFYNSGFEQRVKPTIFFKWRDIEFLPYMIESLSIKIDKDESEETMERILAYWIVNVDVEYPFEVMTIKDHIAFTYERVISQRNMFVLWNLAVVLISLFGLYATLSFVLEQKMKELVIRKVLGASTRTLLIQLIFPFIIAVFISFCIAAVPTFLLMDKWLQRFVYKEGISFMPFVISFLVLLFIVTAILLLKVLKALNFKVINYLKHE